ncbi:hypothetical protein RHGRI_019314 [Rhododendron griersonianum]|uniref:Leucine zipper homeobox-associated domain-containing protein n=1 Tax=Rhododendron griersonianum TaxID=479676 RepID=A0AAV6JGJ4_9ERIC|nr:hypothetical protein RHGRI_019314 [Rhododendron griersonianum]
MRGFDINRSAAECEEEAGVSSPNSTISSVSGKRGEREEAAERGWGSIDASGGDEDDDGGETARKKLRLSREQSAVLEETFKEHTTLNPVSGILVFFSWTKLKQTEVDCEYLKRCCENLTEENRRLQKEVNELRTLKLSPQSYMNMNPPTTLTMCPSCERVAARPPPSSAPASTAPPATSANGLAGHLKPLGPQHQRSYAYNLALE